MMSDIEQWGQSSGSNVIPRRARPGLTGRRPHNAGLPLCIVAPYSEYGTNKTVKARGLGRVSVDLSSPEMYCFGAGTFTGVHRRPSVST